MASKAYTEDALDGKGDKINWTMIERMGTQILHCGRQWSSILARTPEEKAGTTVLPSPTFEKKQRLSALRTSIQTCVLL